MSRKTIATQLQEENDSLKSKLDIANRFRNELERRIQKLNQHIAEQDSKQHFALHCLSSLIAEARRSSLAPKEHRDGVYMSSERAFERSHIITEEDAYRVIEKNLHDALLKDILTNIVGTCQTGISALETETEQQAGKKDPPF